MSNETETTIGGGPGLDGFAELLRQHRRAAGAPSLRDLERLTRQLGRPYARATIDDKLHGRSVPDWAFVEAFVAACHHNAGTGGEPDLADWRAAHVRMLAVRHGDRRRDPLAVTVELRDVHYVVVGGVEEVPASGHVVRLVVEAPSRPAVVLTGLRAGVLTRASAAGTFSPHLGPIAVRDFDLDLDTDPPRLRGGGGADFPYKVTPDDPEVIDVAVHTGTGDVTWTLDLDWISGGVRGTRRVDLAGHPFRTAARP